MGDFKWASVTAISPLRVKLDGDTAALPFVPDSLVDPAGLVVADRVRCELSNRRVVIVGRSQGVSAGNTGDVVMTARTTAPTAWLFCQGQSLVQSSHPSLYAAIGTTYGQGTTPGSTFNVPDFRGRVPVGLDSSQTEFNTLGAAVGAKTHVHPLSDSGQAKIDATAGTIRFQRVGGSAWTRNRTATASTADSTAAETVGTGLMGSTDSASTIQPSRVINFIIKT